MLDFQIKELRRGINIIFKYFKIATDDEMQSTGLFSKKYGGHFTYHFKQENYYLNIKKHFDQ